MVQNFKKSVLRLVRGIDEGQVVESVAVALLFRRNWSEFSSQLCLAERTISPSTPQPTLMRLPPFIA